MKKNNWFNYNDNKPNHYSQILVVDNLGQYYIGHFDNILYDTPEIICSVSGEVIDDVVYWMELPSINN